VGAAMLLAAEKSVRRTYAFAFGHMDAANAASQHALGQLIRRWAAPEPEASVGPLSAAWFTAPPEQEAEQAAQYESEYAETDEDEYEEKNQDQFKHADTRRRNRG
jgi:hypothetical protein